MNQTRAIGIDTTKRVFFLHGEDAGGKVILREKLTRERLLPFLANQPVSTIAIEAGCGAHHWARSFSKLGPMNPASVQFSDFGHVDELVSVRPTMKLDLSSIVGGYRSDTIRTEARIDAGKDGLQLITIGQFGSMIYQLECVTAGIWRAKCAGKTPHGGILSFRNEEFSFFSYHTRSLTFRRAG